MMKKIIFASGNEGKVAEVRKILSELNIQIVSLLDVDFIGEIEENGDSFEENAKIKAIGIFNNYKLPTIADDSGLVVEQLNGEPGIYSARYAGIGSDDEANNIKLLENLSSKPEPHRAKFVCSAAYYSGKEIYVTVGEVYGKLISEARGTNGFGYDPLFVPDGYSKTMAELDSRTKNSISHRFKAFDQIKKHLFSI
ncbi:MAG: RdgB/HAM1 family non-canonical purine NTP pyrophosphatase [Ignavibacteriaceae bacterium]